MATSKVSSKCLFKFMSVYLQRRLGQASPYARWAFRSGGLPVAGHHTSELDSSKAGAEATKFLLKRNGCPIWVYPSAMAFDETCETWTPEMATRKSDFHILTGLVCKKLWNNEGRNSGSNGAYSERSAYRSSRVNVHPKTGSSLRAQHFFFLQCSSGKLVIMNLALVFLYCLRSECIPTTPLVQLASFNCFNAIELQCSTSAATNGPGHT